MPCTGNQLHTSTRAHEQTAAYMHACKHEDTLVFTQKRKACVHLDICMDTGRRIHMPRKIPPTARTDTSARIPHPFLVEASRRTRQRRTRTHPSPSTFVPPAHHPRTRSPCHIILASYPLLLPPRLMDLNNIQFCSSPTAFFIVCGKKKIIQRAARRHHAFFCYCFGIVMCDGQGAGCCEQAIRKSYFHVGFWCFIINRDVLDCGEWYGWPRDKRWLFA